jgi:hypothetical protein
METSRILDQSNGAMIPYSPTATGGKCMKNTKSQKQERLPKKVYHSPKLRACGSVKEQTLTGSPGPNNDAVWTTGIDPST